MNDENPHNKRYRLIMAGYFADWFQIASIWTNPRKMVASRAATAALDDFLNEHSPPSRYKAKE